MLCFPVVVCTVVHIRGTRRGGVERLHRADQLTCCQQIDRDTAFGHGSDPVSKALRTGAQAREVTRPGGDQIKLDALLRNGGRCKGTRSDAGNACKAGGLEEFTTLHG